MARFSHILTMGPIYNKLEGHSVQHIPPTDLDLWPWPSKI